MRELVGAVLSIEKAPGSDFTLPSGMVHSHYVTSLQLYQVWQISMGRNISLKNRITLRPSSWKKHSNTVTHAHSFILQIASD
jgi:hypothetical protein